MIELRSPALQADSLPAEPQGKPKNTGVGSLSLLQWICQTQESSWGCLHCRWTLYQLSYQGSLGTYTRSGIYTCFWFPLENNDPFWSYCSQLNYHFFIDSQAKKKKKILYFMIPHLFALYWNKYWNFYHWISLFFALAAVVSFRI